MISQHNYLCWARRFVKPLAADVMIVINKFAPRGDQATVANSNFPAYVKFTTSPHKNIVTDDNRGTWTPDAVKLEKILRRKYTYAVHSSVEGVIYNTPHNKE